MRYFVEQHDPPVLGGAFVAARTRDVHDFVTGESALLRDRGGALAGFDREDAPLRARRIFEPAQRDEKDRADEDPRGIEPPKHAAMIRAVTRAEIQEKLIAIVKQEKNIPDEMLAPETELAAAGIDSLDSLTILFAIEEQFHISIPDERARAVRTFDDLITIVEDLTAKS